MLLAEATVDLQTLLGVATAVAALIGVGVSFRLFMYRLDRLEDQNRERESQINVVAADVRRLELWRAREGGAERVRAGLAVDDSGKRTKGPTT